MSTAKAHSCCCVEITPMLKKALEPAELCDLVLGVEAGSSMGALLNALDRRIES